MSQGLNIPIETILKAIKGSGGIMSTIAARLDVNWHTADKYVNLHEETRLALKDEEEITLDSAESALKKSIEEGNTQDAKWLLSTKGKRRGYSERHEVTGADGKELNLVININVNKRD